MDLLVKRQIKSENSTIGQFFVNGQFFSYCLEPVDRGLTSDMSLDQISRIKVQNKTAIPTGKYKVTKYFSPKHNTEVPLLNSVPGFAFVEIHCGNFPRDTDACTLLGSSYTTDMVENSQATIDKFYPLFFDALSKGEEIWITYE